MAAKAGSKIAAADDTAGHNSGTLSPEEKEALFLTHLQQARDDDAALEKAQEMVRSVRKVRKQRRGLVTADGFSLALLDEVLKDEGLGGRANIEDREAQRRWMREIAGLPLGTQLDLLKDTPAEARDEIEAEQQGYGAGLRGLEPKPPVTVHPRHHPNWMKGFHTGTERKMWAMAEAGKVADRRANAPAVHIPLAPINEETGETVEA